MRKHVARHFGAEVVYKVPVRLQRPLHAQAHRGDALLAGHPLRAAPPGHRRVLANVRAMSLGADDREKLDQLSGARGRRARLLPLRGHRGREAGSLGERDGGRGFHLPVDRRPRAHHPRAVRRGHRRETDAIMRASTPPSTAPAFHRRGHRARMLHGRDGEGAAHRRGDAPEVPPRRASRTTRASPRWSRASPCTPAPSPRRERFHRVATTCDIDHPSGDRCR